MEGQLEIIQGFLTAWRVGTPNPCAVQGSTVFCFFWLTFDKCPECVKKL